MERRRLPPPRLSLPSSSGFHPRAPTLPDVYEASRKQAQALNEQSWGLNMHGRDIAELRADIEAETEERKSEDDRLETRIDQKTQIIADTAVRLEHRQIQIDTKLAVGWGAITIGAAVVGTLATLLVRWLAN